MFGIYGLGYIEAEMMGRGFRRYGYFARRRRFLCPPGCIGPCCTTVYCVPGCVCGMCLTSPIFIN